MGRARMLTCFAMNSYRIQSHNYVVNGSGGEYHVIDAPFIHGCILDIDVDNYSIDLAKSYLRNFLSTSNIRAAININGQRYINSPAQRGRHVRNLVDDNQVTFANVYVNKSASDQRVIVRVNGVTMFTQSTSFEGQITVELVPEISRSVLTSNRDGLTGDYSDILGAFLSELSVNTKSALRGAKQRRTTRTNNGGALRLRRPVSKLNRQERVEIRENAFQAPVTSAPIVPEVFDTIDIDSDVDNYGYAESNARRAERWIKDTFGDIYITDETDNAKVRKAISAYIPDRWTVKTNYETGGVNVKGGTIIKLLLAWKTCVAYALEICCGLTDDYDHQYSLGFLFNDENTAATHRNANGVHIFSLAPVETDGTLAYALTNRETLMKLMSLAKHEVTHVLHSWHNEAFTTTREQIDFKFDQAECFRRIKDAIKSMPF
ncbi:unnamed protein product [Sphagnum tenellum]